MSISPNGAPPVVDTCTRKLDTGGESSRMFQRRVTVLPMISETRPDGGNGTAPVGGGPTMKVISGDGVPGRSPSTPLTRATYTPLGSETAPLVPTTGTVYIVSSPGIPISIR